MKIALKDITLELMKGDITKCEVDAIVNAANSKLLGGGGVDGAIHRAGGKEIMEECNKIREEKGGCPTGEAVITTAGKLNAKYVIHTVGPIWQGGNFQERKLLRNCYINSLKLGEEHGVQSIAFPNISTGVYRFPKREAAKIAIDTTIEMIRNEQLKNIKTIMFVCFDEENYEIYKSIMNMIKDLADDLEN